MRRWLVMALSVVVLIGLARCGGGGTRTATQQVCSADTFQPNYVKSLERLLYWEVFPVRVYFVRDEYYSELLRMYALNGFTQWVEASANKIRFVEVENPDDAQITVRFDPQSTGGLTTYSYYPSSGQLVKAEIKVGIASSNPVDIQSISAHEFGHALGIAGHSSNPNDMMYPTFVSNRPLQVTEQDFNTLRTAYCALFLGRVHTQRIGSSEEMPVQITIKCPHPEDVPKPGW